MFTADVYAAIILFWNELYGHWLKSQREDEYRNFFICMVQLESCWRTPPLENGREDKSQFLGNKCQKFCQEIHFVFQLYNCLVFITMCNNLLLNVFWTKVMMKSGVWWCYKLYAILIFRRLKRLSLSKSWHTLLHNFLNSN